MEYLMMLGDAKTEINELVRQGLEIILNSENAVPSIIIQLCATLILFLFEHVPFLTPPSGMAHLH